MVKILRQPLVLLSLAIMGFTPAFAQSFNPPMADTYTFGDPAAGASPQVTASYSHKDVPTGFGTHDLYLSAWSTNDPGGGRMSEFIYRFTGSSNPLALVSQGSFLYQGVADLKVGMVFDGTIGAYVVLVAYYDYMGINSITGQAGHLLDMYAINGTPGGPLNWFNQIQLSAAPSYGRISMDSHKDYGVAIAWEHPGVGIETMVGDAGNWSGVTTLDATLGEQGPDVAFSHSSGPLNVHFVYQNPATGTITESVLDWPLLLSTPFGGTALIPPNIEDMDWTPFPISNLVLDCPDHYGVENWAYTYTDGQSVYVRHIDYNTSGVPFTTVVNDGSLGNVPTLGSFLAFNPTLHYGDGAMGGTTGQISVGWYCTYSLSGIGDSHYITLEMREDGSGLLSAPDYNRLPNSVNAYSYPFSGISFSKMSDAPAAIAPDFLYATYFIETPFGSGNYELHHAFHKWNNPLFRGIKPKPVHPECSSPSKKEAAHVRRLSVYPNPFLSTFTSKVNLKEDGMVTMVLTDITGKIVARQKTWQSKGDQELTMNSLEKLDPGSYLLNTQVNGVTQGTQIMIKK
ncbi:MAG: T9SS type A sorting domain-containing protein [Sphingobacteriales bacterium]|nr:MAG: T9SS type A sorting domain-containing protein [Sphingobacteriales bacterium]